MKRVTIYGPGCKRCETAERMVREAARHLGIEVDVEKISDPKAIAMAGVMSTPGIAVDGRLVHAGCLPEATRLEGWIAT